MSFASHGMIIIGLKCKDILFVIRELYYPNNYRMYTTNTPIVHILYNLNEHLQQPPVMCAFDETNRVSNLKLRPECRGQEDLNAFSCSLKSF